MKQGRVAGTCRRDKITTKSQHKGHTRKNVSSTCFSDMLQRQVPSCELILFITMQHQFGGDFVPATSPMKFSLLNFKAELHGTCRRDKITPKLVLHS